jgi:hypothetical protein
MRSAVVDIGRARVKILTGKFMGEFCLGKENRARKIPSRGTAYEISCQSSIDFEKENKHHEYDIE